MTKSFAWVDLIHTLYTHTHQNRQNKTWLIELTYSEMQIQEGNKIATNNKQQTTNNKQQTAYFIKKLVQNNAGT